MANQAQRGQKKTTAAKEPYKDPGQQPPATLQLNEVTPELAISEFAQIASATKAGDFLVMYRTAIQGCPEEGAKWCLPDVNCTARLTMDGDTGQAFTANRTHCGRQSGSADQ